MSSKFVCALIEIFLTLPTKGQLISKPIYGPNISTTPLRQWGFQQCLPFSWTTLRGKHCRHPIAVMGVVDTFGPANLGIFLTQRAGHSYFGADTLCIWRSVELRMSKGTCVNNDKNGIGKKNIWFLLCTC